MSKTYVDPTLAEIDQDYRERLMEGVRDDGREEQRRDAGKWLRASTAETPSPGPSTTGSGPPPTSAAPGTPPTPTPSEPVTGELLPLPLCVGPIDSPSSAPVPAKRKTQADQHLQKVRQVDESIRLKAARVVEYMLDAPQVLRADESDNDGLDVPVKPAGWSDRHYRVALDARLADKDAPAYIRHAARVTEGFRRSEALEDRKPSPTLNCDITVVMKSETTYVYEKVPAKED